MSRSILPPSPEVHVWRVNKDANAQTSTRSSPERVMYSTVLAAKDADEAQLLLPLDCTPAEVLVKYRALLDQIEPEREAYFAALQGLNVSHQETYWLEHNTDFLVSEVKRIEHDRGTVDRRIRAQLRQAQGVKDHIQRLEAQHTEDKLRIQRLLALSQPITGDVTVLLPPGGKRAGAEDTESKHKRTEIGSFADLRWVEKSMSIESDADVKELLQSVQRLREEIEEAKKAYEQEVVELQEKRSARGIEANKVIQPTLVRVEKAASRIEKHELDLKDTMCMFLQFITDGQVFKADALDEHATLARIREQLSSCVVDFKAELQQAAQASVAMAEGEWDESISMLRREQEDVELAICGQIEQFQIRKPQMEKQLSSLEEKLRKSKVALDKEVERYKLDCEGYETDVKQLGTQLHRTKQWIDKLAPAQFSYSDGEGGNFRYVHRGLRSSTSTSTSIDEIEDLVSKLDRYLRAYRKRGAGLRYRSKARSIG